MSMICPRYRSHGFHLFRSPRFSVAFRYLIDWITSTDQSIDQLLYGHGRYGEVMVGRNDSIFASARPFHEKAFQDPFLLWKNQPRIGVDVLIKGRSEFRVDPVAFQKVWSLAFLERNFGIYF